VPRVSVIIPAWNARPFLRQALESVLAQQGVHLAGSEFKLHSVEGLDPWKGLGQVFHLQHITLVHQIKHRFERVRQNR